MTPNAVDTVVLVGGSTRIPRVQSLLQALFQGKQLEKSINADEAVAYGAAVHAARLSGGQVLQRRVILRDTTPLSLGVDIKGGRFYVVVPRNTPVPCRITEKGFCTTLDWQTSITFKIYQGEQPLVKDNHYLNKTLVIPVPPLPEGKAKCDFTFEIDCDGLLTVTCVEPTTGVKRMVTIKNDETKLDGSEVEIMIQNAARFRQLDTEEKEEAEIEFRKSGHIV